METTTRTSCRAIPPNQCPCRNQVLPTQSKLGLERQGLKPKLTKACFIALLYLSILTTSITPSLGAVTMLNKPTLNQKGQKNQLVYEKAPSPLEFELETSDVKTLDKTNKTNPVSKHSPKPNQSLNPKEKTPSQKKESISPQKGRPLRTPLSQPKTKLAGGEEKLSPPLLPTEKKEKRHWSIFSQRNDRNKNQPEIRNPKLKPKKTLLARVTVYWANGSGTDPWSRKNQSSTGERLYDRKHAAVDPKVIPYGSKIRVLSYGGSKIVKAVDTGSAVKARTASKKAARTREQALAPVVDLFFQHKNEALAYAKTHPPFQKVEVY